MRSLAALAATLLVAATLAAAQAVAADRGHVTVEFLGPADSVAPAATKAQKKAERKAVRKAQREAARARRQAGSKTEPGSPATLAPEASKQAPPRG